MDLVGHPTAAAGQLSGAWVVDSIPEVVFGTRTGEEINRIVDAARMPDGSFLVVDQLLAAIHVFGTNGRRIRMVGRRGEGPGELVEPISIEIVKDSIFVVDSGNRRLSVFGPEGHVRRDARIGTPFVLGEAYRFGSGRWLVRGGDNYGLGHQVGLYRDTVEYYGLDGSLDTPRLMARVPGVVGSTISVDGRPGIRTAPYSPRAVAVVRGACAYITTTDQRYVSVYTDEGAFVVRGSFPARVKEVDASLREFFFDMTVERIRDPRERATVRKQAKQSLIFPETLPFTQSIAVDPLGYVWLQRFEPGYLGGTFYILDPSLNFLGSLQAPVAMRLLEVGEDFLIGLVFGPNREEYVQVHALSRPEPPAQPLEECSR